MIIISNNLRPGPKYRLYDLVNYNKHPKRTWSIQGYYYEYMIHAKEIVYYEIACVTTKETLTIQEEDLILVCKAQYAGEYLEMLNKDGQPPSLIGYMSNQYKLIEKELSSMKKATNTPLALTLEVKHEILDELLDRYIDKKNFAKADGEVSEQLQKEMDAILQDLETVRQATIIE